MGLANLIARTSEVERRLRDAETLVRELELNIRDMLSLDTTEKPGGDFPPGIWTTIWDLGAVQQTQPCTASYLISLIQASSTLTDDNGSHPLVSTGAGMWQAVYNAGGLQITWNIHSYNELIDVSLSVYSYPETDYAHRIIDTDPCNNVTNHVHNPISEPTYGAVTFFSF